MIDVGIVGWGFSGKTFQARVIRSVPGLRVAAVVRRSGEPDPEFPETEFLRSLSELLAQPEIQLVVVATPNQSHFQIARDCLRAGKHVVIEKPFTPTYREAAELAEMAAQSGLVLTVYQNRRWDGDFRTVRRLLAEHSLGRLVRYESNFDRFRPQLRPGAWRERAEPGAGVLFDLGAHLIDQTIVLFGTPTSINADVRIERNGAAADDAFDVTLHYPGMRAVLGASVLAATPRPRFRLWGTEAAFTKYGLDPQEEALKAGNPPGEAGWGKEDEERWGNLEDANGSSRVETEAGDYPDYFANIRDAILSAESSRSGRTLLFGE